MGRKLLFLVNPKAGQLELRNHLLEMIDIFTVGGYDVTVHTTQGRGDLTAFLRERGAEFDLAVCAGGDGTLNEAVTGLMQMEHPPVLGYIPGGTVNDVAHTLGISRDPVRAAREIISGVPYEMDVGSFGGGRWFAYVAGFGAFTDVAYATKQVDKRIWGRLAYLMEGAKGLGSIKPIPVQMIVGDTVIEDQVLLGLVCSTTSVGGFRPKINGLDVSLNDGLSEVVVAKNITSVQDLNALSTLLLKREFDPKFFYTFQTDQVRFRFQEPVKWTLDGEYGGSVEDVTVRNCRRAIKIIVPQPPET